MNTENILTIIHWQDEENVNHFGCRGIGEDYRRFYEWLRTTSYKCTSEDWPWDYFIFTSPEDSVKLHEHWGMYIMHDDNR